MNKTLYTKVFIALFTLIALSACSRKKDKFLNRNFHAMGAYYNTIYNGQNALKDGRDQLVQDYQDDYWTILPIERMEVEDKAMLPDEAKNSDFERAEDKATKAIQKHNMLVDGVEYNPQMNKAFLLLGKARYYDQRFFPALEAFNYILNKYGESEQLITAKIWREKAYMRLDNNELALKNLKKLLEEDVEFEDQDRADASATMAQAYLNLGEKDSAIMPLDTAIAYTKSAEEKGRYLYIKGQVYDRLEEIDSANNAFDEVIALNRKSPRVYMINAYMEKARNFDFEANDKEELLALLNEMEEDRENRPYLDKIYYQIAEYYRTTDTLPGSITYYNKSLRTNTEDKGLRYRDYVTLGNINFDAAQYKIAGAYYDSTLTNLAENTRKYRLIRKKRENLVDVIKYEDIARADDSILHLTGMSEAERQAYFKTYADSLKSQAIVEAKEALKEGKEATGDLFGKKKSSALASGGGGSFYFYQARQVSKGLRNFTRTWGDIDLKDDWRTKAGKSNKGGKDKEAEEADFMADIEADPAYDPETYLSTVPTDQKEIDSIGDERNFAYYQLGIIYKEKFKEYGLASDKLEGLLKNDPEERLILPSKYNLYKIYTATENTSEANKWKQDIINNHPDSRYATILQNPRGLLDDENSPEVVYDGVYRLFQQQQFQEVIDRSNKDIERFTGDDIVPKFELLKATAAGRYHGFEAYQEGLNYVALNYPQSEEGKRAEEIISESLPLLKNEEFSPDAPDDHYKLMYVFSIENREEAVKLQEELEEALTEMGNTDLKTSIDIYNPKQVFLVVHGLKSKLGAEGLGEQLKENKDYKVEHDYFGISSSNYKIVQVHKNLEEYLNQEDE